MQVQQMISTHPEVRGSTNDALIRCIEEMLLVRADLHFVRRRLSGRI